MEPATVGRAPPPGAGRRRPWLWSRVGAPSWKSGCGPSWRRSGTRRAGRCARSTWRADRPRRAQERPAHGGRLGLPSHDALHHFIAAGAWDAGPLEAALAREADRLVGGRGAFLIIDDTALPKKGTRSAGVAPQYASALGKNANCQVLVSLTLARREVPVPFALRLFLPEEWTADAERLERAGVPEAWRTPRTKPEIALAEIDRAVAAGVRFGCALADAGYGISAPFRAGLSARGLRWAVGIPRVLKVYPADVVLQPPPAGSRRKLSEPDQRSRPAEKVLAEATWRRVTWRRGTKGQLSARFAAVRIRVADGPAQQIGGRPAQHLPGERPGSSASAGPRARRGTTSPTCPTTPTEDARGHHQGALGVRAGAPAAEGGTRPRPLRGPVLDRPAPPRAHGDARLRLPPAPPPRGGEAGGKGAPEPDLRPSPACPRSRRHHRRAAPRALAAALPALRQADQRAA
jgi:hypothetical protein